MLGIYRTGRPVVAVERCILLDPKMRRLAHVADPSVELDLCLR